VAKNSLPWIVVAACVSALSLAACGSDEPSEVAVPDTPTVASNACPVDGCAIKILDAAREGDEIALTWEPNFLPDVSKNHIHVYWDKYDADQVSSDAEARGVSQGEWVPTAEVPTYVTGSAVSVDNRGASTTLCVTAGDRNHVVIDASIVDCLDVSDLLRR